MTQGLFENRKSAVFSSKVSDLNAENTGFWSKSNSAFDFQTDLILTMKNNFFIHYIVKIEVNYV